MPELCARAGVEPFGFHGIRHLTASLLDKAGIDPSTIQAILRRKMATTASQHLHSPRGAQVALDAVFASKVIEVENWGSERQTASSDRFQKSEGLEGGR